MDDVFDYLCAIMSKYWVYMMQSANGRALYTGVTNDIVRRVGEHKEGKGSVLLQDINATSWCILRNLV